MTEQEDQPKTTKVETREQQPAQTKVWRAVLDGHTAFRELTEDLDVEYRDDGFRIAACPPSRARGILSIVHAAVPFPVRGGMRATGELIIGIGG